MKKVIAFVMLFITVFTASAQEPYKVFAELLGFQKGLFSKKVKVRVDFGQEVSFWKAGDMVLVDEKGKDIIFNSMVDAMNFMGRRGWVFEQAFVVTEGNQNVYHWLLSKMVTSEDQIKEGFQVKADTKGINAITCITFTYLKKKTSSREWDEVRTETLCDLSNDEVQEIVNDWKSKTNEYMEYDVQIKKGK